MQNSFERSRPSANKMHAISKHTHTHQHSSASICFGCRNRVAKRQIGTNDVDEAIFFFFFCHFTRLKALRTDVFFSSQPYFFHRGCSALHVFFCRCCYSHVFLSRCGCVFVFSPRINMVHSSAQNPYWAPLN